VKNPDSPYQNKIRGERSNEMGLPASGFCSRSNPSPGSKISTPEFGCELFVAHPKDATFYDGSNRKLFTAIHNPIPQVSVLNRNPAVGLLPSGRLSA
jgi:hypothetical protein